MNLSGAQRERLKYAIANLRRAPEYSHLRQLIIAESGEDNPDYSGLKAQMLLLLGAELDKEIEAAQSRRRAAIGMP